MGFRLPSANEMGILLFLLISLHASHAAVPLPSGESWDGAGVGGVLTAGPVWRSSEGITPNHLSAHIWYHARTDMVGSSGIEISDWNSSSTQSLFQAQYVGAASWVPWRDSRQLLEVAFRAGGERSTTTLDTAKGFAPIVDDSWDWQFGIRVGGGWNRGPWGLSVSTGPVASWRASGAASGWNMAQESEIGLHVSLQDHWSGSASYTRAWNIVLRIPVVYQPAAPTFTHNGVVNRSQWTYGLFLGPSVLF